MRALFILLLFEGAILVLGDRGRGKTPVISSKQNNDIDENSAQGRGKLKYIRSHFINSAE